MFFQNISFVVVIMSAVVAIGLGFLWYSPIMFFKRWAKEMGYTVEYIEEQKKKKDGQKNMVKDYILLAVFTMVTSFVIAAILNSLIVTGFGGLILLAILLWLAFSMPVALNSVLFGKDSIVLFSINTGYHLVSIMLMTLIIGIFS